MEVVVHASAAIQAAQTVFSVKDDYRQLAGVVYAALAAMNPLYYNTENDWLHGAPYAWEIQLVLNNPGITPELIWVEFKRQYNGTPPIPKELYLEGEILNLVIAITNALRHTVKPAYVNY